MYLTLLTLAIALTATALPLLRLEYPAVAGVVYASGANERWSVKILAPMLVAAALSVPFFVHEPYGDLLKQMVPPIDLHSVVIIGLGTSAAVIVSSVIHRWTSVPYALLGALLGYRFMLSDQLDWVFTAQLAVSWVAAPVLCCLISILLARLLLVYATKPGRHLAIIDQRLLAGCILSTLLLVASAAWNMGQLVTLFPRIALDGGMYPLLFTLALLGILFLFRARYAAQETDSDFGPVSSLAVMLSMTLCFVLFSWPGISRAGLVTTPLSASSLLVAGLVGVSLAQRNAMVSWDEILKSAAASLVAPILGFLLTYCLGMVFSTLVLVGLIAVIAALYIYVRTQRSESRRQEMLRTREEQVYSTQKSLSALEVRAETQEKDLLNKLEIKRKELVDFALGVSEQKAFMENVYDDLSHLREMPDGPAKENALDAVLAKLRERMYFTREMNDFYARTEILHRDFNTRLKEAFPDLTESERKLANLLRQGFSSKYIASLMNITPKSVEISRYRLRIKLGLKRSDNLVKYIKTI